MRPLYAPNLQIKIKRTGKTYGTNVDSKDEISAIQDEKKTSGTTSNVLRDRENSVFHKTTFWSMLAVTMCFFVMMFIPVICEE